MVRVDGVGLEDVVAIHSSSVNILVEYAGVERGVVKVADGERYGARGRWQEAAAPSHKVLGEGHLCVEIKAKSMALLRPRKVRSPRLPRSPEAPAWALSSLLDIVIRVVLIV